MAVAIAASFPYAVGPIQEEVIKKPHLSFKEWSLKFFLPCLPSEQGYWRACFLGDDNRMGRSVNKHKLKSQNWGGALADFL
jgi:hypothetical protein